MTWARRSAANILPLSVEKARLADAVKEWLYSGDMYDLEAPIDKCELCDHPDIRYQFKIVNRLNGNELLVGSECINKFGISATDDHGNILDRDESRRKVSRDRRYLVNEARKRRLVNALVELSTHEKTFDIDSFVTYVLDRDAFTPSQLAFLLWRLDKHRIAYSPADFKITIRRDREKDQLREMESWKIKRLWPSMSKGQRAWVRQHTDYDP